MVIVDLYLPSWMVHDYSHVKLLLGKAFVLQLQTICTAIGHLSGIFMPCIFRFLAISCTSLAGPFVHLYVLVDPHIYTASFKNLSDHSEPYKLS